MPKEIERKFLVTDTSIIRNRPGRQIIQGYLAKEAMTVRVRVMDGMGYLTIKGRREGIARDEFEYPIPMEDAFVMIDKFCASSIITKTRYPIPYGNHVFEVDVFGGSLAGLVVAEVELEDEAEAVKLPPWVGREVTDDPRYGNFDLAAQEGSPSPPVPAREAGFPGATLLPVPAIG